MPRTPRNSGLVPGHGLTELGAALFYAWDITVENGTTEAEPKTEILKLTNGAIRDIDIKFAPGCHGLVKVRLFRYTTQLVPLNTAEWVTGDGEIVPTETYCELVSKPYELKFIGCAPTTVYNHKVTVRVRIEPLEVAAPYRILKDFTDLMKRVMGL